MDKNVLCTRNERYGTLDLWINNEDHWTFGNEDIKWEIIATYNGEDPSKGEAYRFTLDRNPVQALNEFMGHVGRDTENWFFKDIVIHWGVHTWKFYNSKNITTVDKDENCKNLEDIKFLYDVEW